MAKVVFERKKEKAFIKNTIIEELFFEDCTPRTAQEYMKHIREGATHRATARASKDVRTMYRLMKKTLIDMGVDMQYLAYQAFDKNRETDE